MAANYKPHAGRSLLDIVTCWVSITLCILVVTKISWWFYPIVIFVLANRLLALSLICHEGLHGTLARNEKLNDFFGRYLCAFPTFISFSKYRRIHLLHHLGVGTELWDSDRHLYSFFPVKPWTFLKQQALNIVSLKTAFAFIQYYTEIPELLAGKSRHKSSDLIGFLLFHVFVFSHAVYFGWLFEYELFFVVPLLFLTQPYVLLMGGLQHGPVRDRLHPEGVSRSIIGSKWYMWLLLPLDINFHAEHHLNPGVPHWKLKDYSNDLQKNGHKLWKESYAESLKKLFSTLNLGSKDYHEVSSF